MLRAPIVLLWNVLSFMAYLWSSLWFKLGVFLRRHKKRYVKLDLHPRYGFGPKSGLAGWLQDKRSFLELRRAVERLCDDPSVDGVIVSAKATEMGHGQLTEFNRMLDALGDAQKHVVAHAKMPTTRDYLLLSSADDILMSPAGRLYTFGPRFDQYFGRDALDKLGVVAQFIHIGQFKTATHRFIHSQMPVAQRQMMGALYDDLTDVIAARITDRRGLDAAGVDALFARAPMDVRQARRRGFIDGEVFGEAIAHWLDAPERTTPVGDLAEPMSAQSPAESPAQSPAQSPAESPAERPAEIIDADDHLDSAPTPFEWRPLFGRKPCFAVLDLSGMIVMPNMSMPGQGSVVIDPDEVVPTLTSIRTNRDIDGAILHINSPGGSALASDIIWQAIDQLRRTKPVVAQCSDVVGSGGYYLAVAADEIICTKATMTGSIGVITGKMSVPDVPQKLGVNVESIYERDADTFSSVTRPMSDAMMERMGEDARSFYRRFLQRVGQARQLPRRRLHRYGRGRVYFGQAAKRRDLIDDIGGFDMAVDHLAKRCEVDGRDADLSYVHHRQQSLRGVLRGSLKAEVQTHVPDWLTRAFEPAAIAALLERDPLLALMGLRVQ